MDTNQILEKLDKAWKDFEESYAGLSNEELLIPNVTGKWSVRDIIAHVTWWEEESLKHMPVILEGGRPERYSDKYGGIDDFNAIMTVKRSGLSLEEVLKQHDDVHAQLVAYVRAAPEDEFARETRLSPPASSRYFRTLPRPHGRNSSVAAERAIRIPKETRRGEARPARCRR